MYIFYISLREHIYNLFLPHVSTRIDTPAILAMLISDVISPHHDINTFWLIEKKIISKI